MEALKSSIKKEVTNVPIQLKKVLPTHWTYFNKQVIYGPYELLSYLISNSNFIGFPILKIGQKSLKS